MKRQVNNLWKIIVHILNMLSFILNYMLFKQKVNKKFSIRNKITLVRSDLIATKIILNLSKKM